ncbi:MAG: hypothetical protein DI566_05750 [Microbacterium sp.]|nr:MAG: hypothetical protein DI566_05750 [Microbacterium sp.]
MTAAFPETPFAAPTRIDLEPVPLAVVRHDGIRLDALQAAFDEGYAAIAGLFADGVLTPVGPAIAVYYGDPMGEFDLELGFPVATAPRDPVAAAGVPVLGSALPGGPAVAASHFGAYDTLGRGWAQLVQSVDGEPTGVWIESYVSDPTEPAESLRTDLILPVRG